MTAAQALNRPRIDGIDYCTLCVNTGRIYPMRKDGMPDERYKSPSAICPVCDGRMACQCMGGMRDCEPPFGPNGGCSRSDDQ